MPVPDRNHILVWFDTNPAMQRNISVNSSYTRSVFVKDDNDNSIYFDYTQNSTNGISRLTSNFQSIMITCDRCYDIFVDITNNIYCSMNLAHMVIKKSSEVRIIAGTGLSDSKANMLDNPTGIFVDTNFDLYVADCFNDRIQLFSIDQTDGITVAGNGSSNSTIALSRPTGVVLDADRYLFIADNGNQRIIGSGSDGFRCLIGCNQSNSSFIWQSIAFDKFGNIFLVDRGNHQVQKFLLTTNSCSELSNNLKV